MQINQTDRPGSDYIFCDKFFRLPMKQAWRIWINTIRHIRRKLREKTKAPVTKKPTGCWPPHLARNRLMLFNGPLDIYIVHRIANAPVMPRTFFPPPRVSDPDMHHGTCVTHVPWCMPGSLTSGFLWSRWRAKRSRNSRRMRNPQFCVSGKRPMVVTWHQCYMLWLMQHYCHSTVSMVWNEYIVYMFILYMHICVVFMSTIYVYTIDAYMCFIIYFLLSFSIHIYQLPYSSFPVQTLETADSRSIKLSGYLHVYRSR